MSESANSKNQLQPAEDSAASFLREYTRAQFRILGFIHVFIPNVSDAEEILQETSTILWSKWSEFDQSRDFVKWACGIARLEVFNFLRRNRKRLYLSEVVLDEVGLLALDKLQTREQETELQETLIACLESLPAKQRHLMTQCYRQGCSVSQLAAEQSVSERLIYKNLAQIRDLLKRCIERKIQGEFSV